jgi:hypothetical protein
MRSFLVRYRALRYLSAGSGALERMLFATSFRQRAPLSALDTALK